MTLVRIVPFPLFLSLPILVFTRFTLLGAPENLFIDWPMGSVISTLPAGELVMGHNVYTQQNFRSTTNRDFPNQEHTGLDLQLDGGGKETENATVLAVADGIVRCIDTSQWGAQGDVIVIQHDTDLYSVYGHLNGNIRVRLEERVRRGDAVGTVQRWPGNRDNTHVHFEIREFVYWSHDRHEPVETPGEAISCAGPGYLPVGESLSQQTWEKTWLDPVAFYYNHRPPYPRAVVVNDLVSNLAVGDTSRRTVSVYPSPDFQQSPVFHLATSSLVTALGVETVQDSEGITQRFYKVKYDGVNEGYILGFYFVGHGSDLRVGEPLALWQPPSSKPLVDFRFGERDFGDGKVRNWGLGNHDGILVGDVKRVLREDFPDPDATDFAVQMDGETGFIEVENSRYLSGGDSLALEADVWRADNASEDAIVSKWFGGDQWLLTFYPDGSGKLIFTVSLADGHYANVDYLLPDASYLGRWAHVAARYSPEAGLMLFWNRQLVAQSLASDLEAEGHSLEDRAITRGDQPIHVGDANNVWSRFRGRIDDVKVWSPRSLGAATPLDPLGISYFYSFGPMSGTATVVPGDTFIIWDEPGGCDSVFRDTAVCETNVIREIRAYNHDCLSGENEGTYGQWVSRGCSEAKEFGYVVRCCVAPRNSGSR